MGVLIVAEVAHCARSEYIIEKAVKVVVWFVVEDRHYTDVSETKNIAAAEVFKRIFQVMLGRGGKGGSRAFIALK